MCQMQSGCAVSKQKKLELNAVCVHCLFGNIVLVLELSVHYKIFHKFIFPLYNVVHTLIAIL